jgi:NAD(P)-dependent dehydrogenase (short-subunit alcohol dehydrogenase family)
MGTYIVTGATGGIGRAIVEALIANRAEHIVLACRNVARAEALIASIGVAKTVKLEARKLDLQSFDSVRQFALGVRADGLVVSGLMNNAGIMPGGVSLTVDGYEAATQVNFLATMLLTELLLPTMAHNGSAIVFTTSMTRRIARLHTNWQHLAVARHNRFVTYGRSKKMLTAYAAQLSHRVESMGIRVNCSDPGIVDSNIITMGNRFIDMLSKWFFRPLIYTTTQGAKPAIAALRSLDSSMIYTLNGSQPIPPSYSSHNACAIIADVFTSALNAHLDSN